MNTKNKNKYVKIKARNFLIAGMLLPVLAIGQTAGIVNIEGYIPSAEKIMLNKDRNTSLTDSLDIKNGGYFRYTTKTGQVSFGLLRVFRTGGDFGMYSFFMQPGKLKMSYDSTDDMLLVRGSRDNDILAEFYESQRDYFHKAKPLYDSINDLSYRLSLLREDSASSQNEINALSERQSYFHTLAEPLNTAYQEGLIKAIYSHPDTYFAAAFALGFYDGLSKDTVKQIYDRLGAVVQASDMGKELKRKMDDEHIAGVGTIAPVFASTTMDGAHISLDQWKGKYVLLDFWATWCGPCRQGNPHLIKLYKQYHSKGFEIVGIADDDNNINGWKQAVKKDGINIWHQILRRNGNIVDGNASDLSTIYNVPAYPTKILIGPDGRIIGRYTGDDDLENKLAEIL